MKNIPASLALLSFLLLAVFSANAAITGVSGPAGSAFARSVYVLPNGNIVASAPLYDIPAGAADVGAVYLYDGATLALISTLTGSTANDQVGSQITILSNGNFVVASPNWDNPSPATANVGAVTWCSQTTGCGGVVSSANSLIGVTAGDSVGSGGGVTALTNGNYVVASTAWGFQDVGAVTWGNGTSGTSGTVSGANSLIGGRANDQIGSGGVTALSNGNYVVASPLWDNSIVSNVGAVTWGNGAGGTTGTLTAANSLIGRTAGDNVGLKVTALTNGNYVAGSPNWDNLTPAVADVGAATWGDGANGTAGLVSPSNSLVGGSAGDNVGFQVTPLTNGNYVVQNPRWDNPSPLIADVGAATWGSGAGGASGLVSSANSLIGGNANDRVGEELTALTNGNYVVSSPVWDNPSPAMADVGAATWGNGATGTSGLVSSANSLVGSSPGDQVRFVTALTNGNYVVSIPLWDNPSPAMADVGAATWCSGTNGGSGAVSAANSLIGGTSGDGLSLAVTALTNGNYVVSMPGWDQVSPVIANAGAVTLGNGTGGTVGLATPANSLVGGTELDQVGGGGVTALTNGNYVVSSLLWDNPSPATSNAGAVTWASGSGGTVGAVTPVNSLIGGSANDFVGGLGAVALTNGNYVVVSPDWDLPARPPAPLVNDVGAVTWANGAGGTTGVADSVNSLVGEAWLDRVGSGINDPFGGGVTAFSNGNFAVHSPFWDGRFGSPEDSATSFANGWGGTNGFIGPENSIRGSGNVIPHRSVFDASRNRLVVGREQAPSFSIIFFSTTAIADGDLNNPANWDNGLPNGSVTGVIPPGRTMTISSVMNAGQIHVQCGGSLTGGSPTAYIVGSVRRDFCGAAGETFVYPIGDPSNYSPLTVSNATGSGNLTAAAIDTFMPGLNSTATSLSRYWSLAGSGITANLSFSYKNADVNGFEGAYRIFRRPLGNNALISQYPAATFDAVSNTFTALGVSAFSDWTAGAQQFVPTAATGEIGGRVMTSEGTGIRNAVVTISGGTLPAPRTVRTGSFGYFRFDGLEVGATYTVTVAAKRSRFVSDARIVNLLDNALDVDFVSKE